MEDTFPIIYQSVDLDVNFTSGSISAKTEIWMGVKESPQLQNIKCLNLHCRKCRIKKITINGQMTEYCHTDPFSQNLLKSNKSSIPNSNSFGESYLSEEIDMTYRAAMEISRLGELQIVLPDHLPKNSSSISELPSHVIKSSRYQDVVSRYNRLVENVSALADSFTNDSTGAGDGSHTLPKLLVISIEYDVPSDSGEGIVFRYPYSSASSNSSRMYTCGYTIFRGCLGLSDLHGVRCWLPVADSLGQRPVFDVTIRAPHGITVLCSGRHIDSQSLESISNNRDDGIVTNRMMHRYFSTCRLPARSFGIFMGHVEKYSLSLYRTAGRVWVVRELVDIRAKTVPSSNQVSSSSPPRVEHKKAVSKTKIDPSNKRRRLSPSLDQPNDQISREEEEEAVTDSEALVVDEDIEGSNGNDDDDDDNSDGEVGIEDGKLYREAVRHTTLGFDLAARLLHKYTQRRYDHFRYTQIFVHGLEEDFQSFDGFSLINARYLISSEDIAQETGSHLLQLSAYLTSWLCAGPAIPTSSLDCDFILQGCVAGLCHDYCESVFGEDSAAYKYQKALDTVVGFEKLGFSFTLCPPYFPEAIDRIAPYYTQYFLSKSAVLFHMIGLRLGGRDTMRSVYQFLIKSPSLSTPAFTAVQSSSKRHASLSEHPSQMKYQGNINPQSSGSRQTEEEHFGSSLAYLGLVASPSITGSEPATPYGDRDSDAYSQISPQYPGSSSYSPAHYDIPSPNPYTNQSYSPNPYAAQSFTPNPYANQPYSPNPYSIQPYSPNPYGSQQYSPNPYGSQQYSPNPYSGQYSPPNWMDMLSPARSRSNSIDNTNTTGLGGTSGPMLDSDNFPVPQPTTLRRQISQSSVTASIMAVGRQQMAEGSIVSLDTFLSSLQTVAGTDADLDENLIDNYVCDSGIQLVRFGVLVAPKLEGRKQSMNLVTDSAYLRNGKIPIRPSAKSVPAGTDVRTRVVELRDDLVTEPFIRLTPGEEEVYFQFLHTKSGRRRGSRKVIPNESDAQLTPAQLAEKQRQLELQEASIEALEVARKRNEPVRYALLDPQCMRVLGEVHLLSSPASMIEQLYAEVDGLDVLRQIQAVRSLARMAPLVYPTKVATIASKIQASNPRRQDNLIVAALYDCLVGTPITANHSKVVNNGHCVHVRIEAAFALAQWQIEHAPVHTSTVDSSTSDRPENDEWIGLSRLVDAMQEMYLDSITLLPLACDWTQEGQTQLRSAVLSALSIIRAPNGVTPSTAVKTLMLFAESHVNIPVISHFEDNINNNTLEESPDDINEIKMNGRKSRNQRNNNKVFSIIYDDSQYVANMLLALKNVKVDSFERKPTDTLHRISDFAVSRLSADIAMAKARARVAITRESLGDRMMPVLPLGGAVSAAAIACAGEMDIQFTILSEKEKRTSADLLVVGSHGFKVKLELGMHTLIEPKGVGSLSNIRYPDLFIPAGHHLTYCENKIQESTSTESAQSSSTMVSRVGELHRDYDMYPSSVKLSALEAFIRLCFTQHTLFIDKLRRQQSDQTEQSISAMPASTSRPPATPVFISAIVEAVVYVSTYDPDRRTRRGAALCFLECLQGRPTGRAAMAASCHADVWCCLGRGDTDALTRYDPSATVARGGKRSFASSNRDLFVYADGVQMKRSVRLLWLTICQSHDEEVRTLLYRSWLYLYGSNVPSCLSTTQTERQRQAYAATALIELKQRLWGPEISILPRDRLSVRDPGDCLYRSEMALRHGKGYKLAAEPRETTITTTSSNLNFTQPQSSQNPKLLLKTSVPVLSSQVLKPIVSQVSGNTTSLRLSLKPPPLPSTTS